MPSVDALSEFSYRLANDSSIFAIGWQIGAACLLILALIAAATLSVSLAARVHRPEH